MQCNNLSQYNYILGNPGHMDDNNKKKLILAKLFGRRYHSNDVSHDLPFHNKIGQNQPPLPSDIRGVSLSGKSFYRIRCGQKIGIVVGIGLL